MVSSTKGATGHLLGAAGAVEAAFTVLSIADEVVCGTRNLDDLDVDIEGLDFVKEANRKARIDVAMSNSFGFGGTNASLIFVRDAA